MNEKVKAFLDEKQKQEKAERDKLLVELGLFDLQPKNEGDKESDCFYEWDHVNSRGIWYKKAAIEVTDEEYEEIRKFAVKSNSKNGVASALKGIGITTFILGTIVGLVGACTFNDEPAGIIFFFTMLIASFVEGIIFIGFSEIIKLLNDIKNK